MKKIAQRNFCSLLQSKPANHQLISLSLKRIAQRNPRRLRRGKLANRDIISMSFEDSPRLAAEGFKSKIKAGRKLKSFLLVLMILLSACRSAKIEAPLKELQEIKIFLSQGQPTIRLKVEKAVSTEEQMQGLMFRKSLPLDQGMLFVFNEDQTISFWMKNTFISLDILYIDRNFKIVSIAAETKPLSEDPIFSSVPYRYVIEVNAGFAKQHQLRVGDRIQL